MKTSALASLIAVIVIVAAAASAVVLLDGSGDDDADASGSEDYSGGTSDDGSSDDGGSDDGTSGDDSSDGDSSDGDSTDDGTSDDDDSDDGTSEENDSSDGDSTDDGTSDDDGSEDDDSSDGDSTDDGTSDDGTSDDDDSTTDDGSTDGGSSDSGTSDDDETETITEVSDTITVSGTYAGYFSAELVENEDGTVDIVLTLDDDIAGDYSTFTWYLYTSSGTLSAYTSAKTEATVTWYDVGDVVGEYVMYVRCSSSSSSGGFMFNLGPGSSSSSATYYVYITLDGTVTKTFTFSYGGCDYEVTVDILYSEYAASISGTDESDRMATTETGYEVLRNFLVVDDVTAELEAALSAAYAEATGLEASGQGYAEFLLAFVQCCFTYYEDSSLYGTSEFFAYPLETIYNGGGDCEDTSILLACLYISAGYDAGIFVIPGHAIAAVALDEFTATEADSRYGVSLFSYTTGGTTYYGCETTITANYYGVGWISSDYGIDDEGNVYYGGSLYETDLDYGLKLPLEG